jgi:mono/diheme cytochrome c family protein
MRFRIIGLLVSGAALAVAGTAAIGAELPAGVQSESQRAMPGAALYVKYCAECHDGSVAKAPSTTFLQLMPPDAVLAAQTTGVMQRESRKLSVEQKTQVAEYVQQADVEMTPPPLPRCTGEAANSTSTEATDRGWGFDLANSRYRPTSRASPGGHTEAQAQVGARISGRAARRSQPTFAMGALCVGSQDGRSTLDAATVVFAGRSAQPQSEDGGDRAGRQKSPGPPLAYFGDDRSRLCGRRVDRRIEWKIKTDKHPRRPYGRAGAVQDRLYVPVSSTKRRRADPAYPCCSFAVRSWRSTRSGEVA